MARMFLNGGGGGGKHSWELPEIVQVPCILIIAVVGFVEQLPLTLVCKVGIIMNGDFDLVTVLISNGLEDVGDKL